MVLRRFVVSLSRRIRRTSHHRRRDQSNTQQNCRGRFGYRRSRRADAHRSDCGVERPVVRNSGEIVGTDAAEIDEENGSDADEVVEAVTSCVADARGGGSPGATTCRSAPAESRETTVIGGCSSVCDGPGPAPPHLSLAATVSRARERSAVHCRRNRPSLRDRRRHRRSARVQSCQS